MLSDAIMEFLQGIHGKPKDPIAGEHLGRFLQKVVRDTPAFSIDAEPLPEHYKELLRVLRSSRVSDVDVKLFRRVIASRLRDMLVEKDAAALVALVLEIAGQQQRITVNKAFLRGTLRALDQEGELLDRCVSYLKALPSQQLTGVWQNRLAEYSLLEKPFGQTVAAQLFVAASRESAEDLLVQSGLRELGDDGLRQLVHRQLTVRLSGVLKNQNTEQSSALLALIVWERQAVGDAGFRFSGERNKTAESLLLPWKSTNPSQDLKNALLKFFLEHYGDPRRESSWLGVSDEPQAIIRRWLAEASFELFISIIKQVAPDQWQAREKFWRYYLSNNYVLDLKVAFGTKAARIAQEMNRKSGLGEQLVFSRLTGAQLEQSVMVMSLNRCTVVEWSHSGKFRLWRDGNRAAPSLLELEYRAVDMRSSTADEAVIHSGRWLDEIGAAIHRYSGIPAQR